MLKKYKFGDKFVDFLLTRDNSKCCFLRRCLRKKLSFDVFGRSGSVIVLYICCCLLSFLDLALIPAHLSSFPSVLDQVYFFSISPSEPTPAPPLIHSIASEPCPCPSLSFFCLPHLRLALSQFIFKERRLTLLGPFLLAGGALGSPCNSAELWTSLPQGVDDGPRQLTNCFHHKGSICSGNLSTADALGTNVELNKSIENR